MILKIWDTHTPSEGISEVPFIYAEVQKSASNWRKHTQDEESHIMGREGVTTEGSHTLEKTSVSASFAGKYLTTVNHHVAVREKN